MSVKDTSAREITNPTVITEEHRTVLKIPLKSAVIALIIAVISILNGCSDDTEAPLGTGVMDETLRFVFMADSRGDSLAHPVNDTVLNAIISQISMLSPKPSFVMFGGDMSYRGYIGSSYTFQAWKDKFAPLISNGIKLYTAIGNHELYHQHPQYGFKLANQQAFQSTFTDNPSNGPAGYERLAYSFTSPGRNSFFAVLDPYFLTADIIPTGLGGNIDDAQMSWLRSQVSQTNATHKFLFIHTPYYYMSSDTAEPSSANQTYTRLWSYLDSNKFDVYACGHLHFFARRTVDSTVLPNPQTTPPTPPWQNNVVQLLNGTCGAGPDSGHIDPVIRLLWNVHNDPKTYYFSVIDIAGSVVTVNSYKGYKGAYSIFDTFTISR
ncbi:MAG: metallophosphoesterase [Ignavibacteria bacterium]|nr:metallophosphoesterase [Ignavibacteria bacterium]